MQSSNSITIALKVKKCIMRMRNSEGERLDSMEIDTAWKLLGLGEATMKCPE